MRVKIITPTKVFEFNDAKFIALRTLDGEMGLLDKRAPIIAKLAVADLRIKLEDHEEKYKVVDGFVHCDGNSNVVILTEELGRPEDFDPHKYLGNIAK